MLLRRLAVVLGPLLLCLLTCVLFRWLDGLAAAGGFFPSALKGLLLGAALGLLLPVAGVSTRHNGLIPWLYGGAGVLALLIACQYLKTLGLVHWPVLVALFPISGQSILAEGAMTGFLLTTALLHAGR